MIQPIRPRTPQPPRPAPATKPEPDRALEPLDFARIDNPREAAMLPALDPAVQFGMWTAFTAGAVAGLPHVGLSVSGSLGDRDMHIAYDVDRSRLVAEGFIGSSHVSERSGEQQPTPTIHVTGKIGSSTESFDISVQEDGFHLDGQFGTIPVHVAASFEGAREDGDPAQYLVMRGTIGDQDYELRAALPDSESTTRESVLRATGHLGDLPIQKDYRLLNDGRDGLLAVEGEGTIGGDRQQIQVILSNRP